MMHLFNMSPTAPRAWKAAATCLLVVVACLGTTHIAQAQDQRLTRAMDAYDSLYFEDAKKLFIEVAEDSTADRDARREAFHHLGRIYVASNALASAREALAQSLEFEPPLVELNPDRESPPFLRCYYDARREVSGSYEMERADPGMKTLAVIDFTNSSIDDYERVDPLRQGFASMMINYLNGATNLKVVERERLQWLIEEQNLQQDAARVDQETAVRMGKVLGAQTVLMGSYIVNGRRLYVGARLVKVETGEVLLSEQVEVRSSEFFDAIKQLSVQVAQAINVNLSESQAGARTETRSLDAIISYSEGLALLEKNAYREAYEKFLEALSYDENYTRAQLKAESIRPLLRG